MAKESFLLVSLKGSKAKKLAQVISNETSRKILDYLAENKKATESELSKELSLPISTVHYNIKHLVEAKLLKADEFHYSDKGKEVNHYSLTNKYIIIAPESTTPGIKDRLKSILPVALIALATAGIMQILSKYYSGLGYFASKSAQAPMAAEAGGDLVLGAERVVVQAPVTMAGTNFVLWFLIGAVFVILVYLFVEWLRNRK